MSLLKKVKRRLKRKGTLAQYHAMEHAPSQIEMQRIVGECETVIDLGSGANPIEGATAAVDLFVGSEQRSHGEGAQIDKSKFENRGIRFVEQSIDQPLPFAENEFDFVYSSHVIEHVENPGSACDEMMRIGKQGLLRCPAIMGEFLYGRVYHRWMVAQRAGTIVFIEKTADEFSPFGSDSDFDLEVYNPIEALLDWDGDGPGTPSSGLIGRLKKTLQLHFYGRTPLSEVNLFWQNGFNWVEVHANGRFVHGGCAGTQYSFDVNKKRQDFTMSI